MNRPMSRRAFLATSGGVLAGGSALAASDCSEARAPQPPGGTAAASQLPAGRTEDGVVYHREMYKSDLMKGFPPPKGRRVTAENWSETTEGIRYAHLNPDSVFRTAPIEKGNAPVWLLPRKMLDPERLHRAKVLWGETRKNASQISVAEWLNRSQTDALVVLHNGHIVAEIYCGEMTPHTPHLVWCGKRLLVTVILRCGRSLRKSCLHSSQTPGHLVWRSHETLRHGMKKE